MEKKWFVALLMVVVMMYACWTGAVADEERKTFTSGDYEYALLDDGTVEITGYNGKAEKLTIPNMLNGKKVTSIDNRAFYLCNSLISIIIPDSVEKISINPFAYCRTLKSIFVSSEHPYFFAIDGVLFRKADSCLISYPKGREYTTYNIPQGITAIESSAFYDCKFLTRVTIPDSVTSIGDCAFYLCSSLTSISIPDSVTSIGDCAFYLCSSLTSVSIPDSVEQIGTNPFVACSALQTISVSPDHPYFSIIDGALFRKADKALIFYLDGTNSSTYTIPQGITDIGDDAFARCSSLTSVSIPDSVTAIGDYVFYGCTSLTSVSIPDSVTSIGNTAFGCCFSLTSVSIPDSVTAIESWAFYACSSLTSVSIPNSVTAIGDNAFSDCPNLTLTVPRNSYAAEYAKTNNIPYTYPDANDWLNN